MPTTLFPFLVQPGGMPFLFSPTLDGDIYNGTVYWNVAGQRWYISLTGIGGVRVFDQALVGSSPTVPIQSIGWKNGSVTFVAAVPHGFDVGQTFDLTVRDCLPDGYNGRHRAIPLDAKTILYPLAGDPGDATALGQGGYDIDLAQTYFQQSTLVFRVGTQTFEVFSP